MYKFLIKVVKFLTTIFRFVQVLGLVYLFMYIIYWFMQVGQSTVVHKYDGWYSYITPITDMIIDKFPAIIEGDFAVIHLDTIISILIYVLILLIYNYIFIFLDRFLEKLLGRGYRTGELQDHEIPYNKV